MESNQPKCNTCKIVFHNLKELYQYLQSNAHTQINEHTIFKKKPTKLKTILKPSKRVKPTTSIHNVRAKIAKHSNPTQQPNSAPKFEYKTAPTNVKTTDAKYLNMRNTHNPTPNKLKKSVKSEKYNQTPPTMLTKTAGKRLNINITTSTDLECLKKFGNQLDEIMKCIQPHKEKEGQLTDKLLQRGTGLAGLYRWKSTRHPQKTLQ